MNMKLALLTLAYLLISGCGSDSPPSVHAQVYHPIEQATTKPVEQTGMSLGSPDPMAIACASGFVRATPHYCMANPPIAYVFPNDINCHNLNVTQPPSSATLVDIEMKYVAVTGNAIQSHNQQVSFYSNNTCTTTYTFFNNIAREFVATVAGTSLNTVVHRQYLPWSLGGGNVYYKTALLAGAAQTFSFKLFGYWD
jgi:hypothetical protein